MSQLRKVEMSHLGYRAFRLFGGIEHGGVAHELRKASAGRDADACGFRPHTVTEAAKLMSVSRHHAHGMVADHIRGSSYRPIALLC